MVRLQAVEIVVPVAEGLGPRAGRVELRRSPIGVFG